MNSNFPCAGKVGGTEGAGESRAQGSEPPNGAPGTLKDLGAVMSGRPDRMRADCGLVGEARIGGCEQRPCQQQEFRPGEERWVQIPT